VRELPTPTKFSDRPHVDLPRFDGTWRSPSEAVVAAARRDGRDRVGCIVLGRGADEAGVLSWLGTAATVPGFIGFAIGRTSFWDPLVGLRDRTRAMPRLPGSPIRYCE